MYLEKIPAERLALLDTLPLLPGGHGGSKIKCCARELLQLVLTGTPGTDDIPCITAHQSLLIPLNDAAGWRDDAHRTSVMRPLLKRLIRCARDDGKDQDIAYRLADYAVRVCAAESLDAAGMIEQAGALRSLPAIADEATQAAACVVTAAAATALRDKAFAPVERRAVRAAVVVPAAVARSAAYPATIERYTSELLTIVLDGYGV